jgi:hypothetical protein
MAGLWWSAKGRLLGRDDALGKSFAPLVPKMVVPTGAVLLIEGFIGELHLMRREFM